MAAARGLKVSGTGLVCYARLEREGFVKSGRCAIPECASAEPMYAHVSLHRFEQDNQFRVIKVTSTRSRQSWSDWQSKSFMALYETFLKIPPARSVKLLPSFSLSAVSSGTRFAGSHADHASHMLLEFHGRRDQTPRLQARHQHIAPWMEVWTMAPTELGNGDRNPPRHAPL